MSRLIIPKDYKSSLNTRETERAIKFIKDNFEHNFAKNLNLERVSAPLFVRPETGLNDNLNGVERPVAFDISDISADVEIVQSLAKWKRMALKQYGFNVGEGLYTDMNAIRRDEVLDNLHSVYVDQWDWELIIDKSDRNLDTLKSVVKKIIRALSKTEKQVNAEFEEVNCNINSEVYFLTTQELENLYPDKTPKEREDLITKKYGTVFLMQIGEKLKNSNMPHDGRAPDYDDWSLNGDILVWNEILNRSFEISSMGIRVNETAMEYQLRAANCLERKNNEFHKKLLAGELPYTIGGGIGQSRLCMLMLKKAHIGEVQASTWGDDMITLCRKNAIFLL